MIFEAKLKLDGGDAIEILQCSYVMDRETDSSGMPSTTVRGGKISITMKSSSDTALYEWIINPYAQKSGEIEFYKHNDPTPAKVLKFTDAYIVEQGEVFNVMDNDRQPMVEHFVVSAQAMAMNDAELANPWRS